MTRRSYKGTSQPTVLTAPISNSDLAATVADGSTLPDGISAPFVLTINRQKTGEEKILCSSRSANSLVFAQRGFDGTTPSSHGSGESVEHTISAVDLDEANAHVNSTTSVHGIADTTALLTTAAANAAYRPLAARGARVTRSALGGTIPDSTPTPLSFDTETFDTNGLHDNVTNNDRVVLNATGLWLVSGQISYSAATVGGRQARLHKNGVFDSYTQAAPVSGSATIVTVSAVIQATAITDYVQLNAYQNSGAPLGLGAAGESWLSAVHLGG